MRTQFVCLFAAAVALTSTANAKPLNVFACEPEWGALSSEIGGDKVKQTINVKNGIASDLASQPGVCPPIPPGDVPQGRRRGCEMP